jgi:2-oxoisovalerate dehydrogenase E2 component (dihydrolipoyl transacylase)
VSGGKMLMRKISLGKRMPRIQPALLRRKLHATNLTLAIKPFLLADIGEGIAEVELMAWYVKKGDKVKAFDKLCEVQSDKATVEITSRFNGIIANVYHKEGDIVKVPHTAFINDLSEGRERLG